MSYFQRRHYEALAYALRRAGARIAWGKTDVDSEGATQCLEHIIHLLEMDNPRFDESRFREAVGWE